MFQSFLLASKSHFFRVDIFPLQFPVSNDFEIGDDYLWSEIHLVLSEAFEDRLADAGVQVWDTYLEQLGAI